MVVANDVRGRYASEGTWRLIVDDPADGFDVVEWIAAPGVVRRQGRDLRHQLSGRHPARARRDEPAAPDDDGADRFRIELRRQRNAPRRSVRAAIHELDLPDRRTELEGSRWPIRPSSRRWRRADGESASTPTACPSGRATRRFESCPNTNRG